MSRPLTLVMALLAMTLSHLPEFTQAGETQYKCGVALGPPPQSYSRGWHMIDGELHFIEGDFYPEVIAPKPVRPEIRIGRPPNLQLLKTVSFNVKQSAEPFHFKNDGATAMANIYLLQTESHEVRIVVPKSIDQNTIGNEIIKLVLELPVQAIKTLSVVQVNLKPKTYYGRGNRTEVDETAGASGLGGLLQIYPHFFEVVKKDSRLALHIFRHELGHLVAESYFGHPLPQAGYIDRVQKDGTSVSPYGDTSMIEDFAEAHAEYLKTEGGAKDPERRRRFSNRFDFLDVIYRGEKF